MARYELSDLLGGWNGPRVLCSDCLDLDLVESERDIITEETIDRSSEIIWCDSCGDQL